MLCSLLAGEFGVHGQQSTSVPRLFEQLQSEATTDQANQEFLKLGPSNSDARKYLAAHLPSLISQKPEDHPHVWINAIRLAGAFRIVEAIPALAGWVGLPASQSGMGTLAETERLDSHPAGKALVQIGEPAIPALLGVLNKGTTRERWVTYRALILIGSTGAITGLREHLSHESDPNLKMEIQRGLERK